MAAGDILRSNGIVQLKAEPSLLSARLKALDAPGLRAMEVPGEEKGVIKTNPLVHFKTDSFENGEITGHWALEGNNFTRADTLKERGVVFPGWLKKNKINGK